MDTQMEAKPKAKPETLKLLRKRIKDRERRFKKATPAGKRVMIAKDVIEHLELGKIKAFQGTWWENMPANYEVDYQNGHMTVIDDYSGRDLRDLVLEQGEDYQCTACAVGAMFYCSVLRKDDITRGEARARYDYMAEYMDYFDKYQLWLIENAFEMGSGCSTPGVSVGLDDYNLRNKAVEFGQKFRSSSDRMRAIMQNIIKHKGEFRPEVP